MKKILDKKADIKYVDDSIAAASLQGLPGIGFFWMEIDDVGDLYLCVPEGYPAPNLHIDENGDLIYEMEVDA